MPPWDPEAAAPEPDLCLRPPWAACVATEEAGAKALSLAPGGAEMAVEPRQSPQSAACAAMEAAEAPALSLAPGEAEMAAEPRQSLQSAACAAMDAAEARSMVSA